VRKVEVNVRIVAATNRNLDSVIGDGTFRADLLYRINSFQIHLAPLRERPEDVEPLMHYILKQLGGANPPEVTAEALGKMRTYAWPGNVRQLRNCLERAILLSNEGRITSNELPPEVARSANGVASFVSAPSSAAASSGDTMAQNAGDAGSQSGTGSLRDVEKQQIISALEQTGWHRGKAAEMLGISPSTLYRRLRDYNLESRLR
jgi:DNA-binding NtrC family response regulator